MILWIVPQGFDNSNYPSFSPLMRISHLSCLSPHLKTITKPTANLIFNSGTSLMSSYNTSFRFLLSTWRFSLNCQLSFTQAATGSSKEDFLPHVPSYHPPSHGILSPCPAQRNLQICSTQIQSIPLQYFLLSILLFIISFSAFYFPFFNSSTYDACQPIYHLASQVVANTLLLCPLQISALSLHKSLPLLASLLEYIKKILYFLSCWMSPHFWVIFCYKPPVHSSGSSLYLLWHEWEQFPSLTV